MSDRQLSALSGRFLRRYLIFILPAVIVVALIAWVVLKPDRKAALEIIYTGGIKGAVSYEEGNSAGYAKIASYARQCMEISDKVLLVDTGDCFGGSETAEINNGSSMVEIMNNAGYDYMVPGINDFIYGSDGLQSLRADAAFPFLAANITDSSGTRIFEDYMAVSAGNIRVGIIGVTSGPGDKVLKRSGIVLQDPYQTVLDISQELSQNVECIIVTAYIDNIDVLEMIADIPEVDLVIGSGGEESFEKKSDSGTYIVSPGSLGKVFGAVSIELERDDLNISNIFIDGDEYAGITEDEDTKAAVDYFQSKYQALGSEIVGIVDTGSGGQPEMTSSSKMETPTGDYIADAMLSVASEDGAELAIIRGSRIGGVLYDGAITRSDVNSLFADDLVMVLYKMTGGELHKLLEDSFKNYPDNIDFLQTSGLSMVYSDKQVIGSKLTDIIIGSHAIDDSRMYLVASTSDLSSSDGQDTASFTKVAVYKSMGSVVTDYISGRSGISADTFASPGSSDGEDDYDDYDEDYEDDYEDYEDDYGSQNPSDSGRIVIR